MSRRWLDFVEIGFLLALLGISAVLHFSQISPQRRAALELKVGLQQLRLLEHAYFPVHGQYFDPTEVQEAMGWYWMRSHQWEVELARSSFHVRVRADMNGDGHKRWWWISSEDRLPLQLSEN